MKDRMLEFCDWPMFDRIMMDASLCREVLEVILDRPVSQVEHVIAERDIRPSFASHGVRLDAFVQTDNEVYDIEMQTSRKGKLGRRLRYYQGSIDTLSLHRGEEYEKLPPCFIIFICTCDPFGCSLPVYTFDMTCAESDGVVLDHGFTWIVLSAPAWRARPQGSLRNLLHYVMTGDAGADKLVRKINEAVIAANNDEVWRREKVELLTWERDMEIQKRIAIEEGIAEGRAEGRARGLAEGRARGIAEGRAEGLAEGLAEGRAEGRAEGFSAGIEEGESRLAALIAALMEAGRTEDAHRAATDADAREQLQREIGSISA